MLTVIGIGPGSAGGMTLEARAALSESELIIGYSTYIDLVRPFFPDKAYAQTGMRRETERVRMALEAARTQRVALVCSGDAAVYGMAGLALELAPEYPGTEVEVIPGVTAALSGSAVLGAPLTHDFAVISLSDLLTPQEQIERRLHAAAEADFVIVLYNPVSRSRPAHLQHACELILQHRPPETLCGYVRQIGREGQESRILPLSGLLTAQLDMFTTVFIGSSTTIAVGGKLVTPRGYHV
ncbi:MAG: precorrin-3B C(17)-methyltransferase [Oscillospiraceae bacterium]|nr:precorrin-3B C(17)-methyltransferase [Oscillospiraceae bacterium]